MGSLNRSRTGNGVIIAAQLYFLSDDIVADCVAMQISEQAVNIKERSDIPDPQQKRYQLGIRFEINIGNILDVLSKQGHILEGY